MPKEHSLRIRCTEAYRDAFNAHAEQRGMTFTEWAIAALEFCRAREELGQLDLSQTPPQVRFADREETVRLLIEMLDSYASGKILTPRGGKP